jgi:hypothetical protein
MNEEERANEIRAIKKLLSEVEAMARYQMIQVEKLRAQPEDIEWRSKQVKAVEDGGEGVAGGG